MIYDGGHLGKNIFYFQPIYKWWQLPYYWAGIKAYDLVSGGDILRPSYVLSKSKALELFPMLKDKSLKGAIVYYDGMHNDARMCLSIAITAARLGANIANHVEVLDLIKKDGVVAGARV